MKIVVTGSLGNISKPLAISLVEKGHEVTVVSSQPERQSEIESIGAKAAIGTMLDVDFLTQTFAGADLVYSMVTHGKNAFFEQQTDVVALLTQIGANYKQAIEKSGVKKVIHLSSIGADRPQGNGILVFHYNIEQLLSQLPDEVAVKFMRPMGFYYNMLAYIPSIKANGTIISNYGGDEVEPWVSPLDIAATIAEEVELPFVGKSFRYIASDEVSPNEATTILGNAIEMPDLKRVVVSDEQMLQRMIGIGMNPETAKGFVEMNASIRTRKIYEHYYQHHPVLGKVKLSDFAKDFALAFKQS
ncbi:Uncharacterized conserved protein YbjT, contains NAD(P)-binding and DUF2867 domains [Flexibacter flexilis DSM 6793]|uniref:Uncharacterized conserved protein YbjT, contains NAD(P)-binding and DUF2867 domains n=1 Tax=Flexibacter flexilis DSM 6793 TaxID=927664 RepID=A0A1I1L6U5_9BACT|nr:NAD(P)H-binding protein [Flexibacter flexilis]SFC68784.1 Uncharacterized conserved protein YbjT, contains NAD(P)-binding and DUF2867 domains [Flexibacter flexilis DSM 6793]